jgi:hypothetical protein
MISKRVLPYVLLCVIFLGIIYLMVPWPRSWAAGLYDPYSGWIWCTTQTTCIHEVGHKLDDEAGWISQSKEFGETVQKYIATEFKYGNPPSYLATKILTANEYAPILEVTGYLPTG